MADFRCGPILVEERISSMRYYGALPLPWAGKSTCIWKPSDSSLGFLNFIIYFLFFVHSNNIQGNVFDCDLSISVQLILNRSPKICNNSAKICNTGKTNQI